MIFFLFFFDFSDFKIIFLIFKITKIAFSMKNFQIKHLKKRFFVSFFHFFINLLFKIKNLKVLKNERFKKFVTEIIFLQKRKHKKNF